jgi:predicted DNA-binding protein (MmcQ/YjbR family)
MHIESFREFCLSLAGTTEEFPFDEQTLVFKVGGKIFALTNVDYFDSVNIKCDPETAVELREKYNDVKPGYHMNKKHWNTIAVNGDVPDAELLRWVKYSYTLVLASLPKKIQNSIQSAPSHDA